MELFKVFEVEMYMRLQTGGEEQCYCLPKTIILDDGYQFGHVEVHIVEEQRFLFW
jgi:hypothetical protein